MTKSVPINNRPIYGILSEPLLSTFPQELHDDALEFVSMSHVRFLESAGARVVPVRFDQSNSSLIAQLNSLNGLYIPGENSEALTNPIYKATISTILRYVRDKFTDEEMLFPIVAMNHGFLSILIQEAKIKAELLLSPMKFLEKQHLYIDFFADPNESFSFDS